MKVLKKFLGCLLILTMVLQTPGLPQVGQVMEAEAAALSTSRVSVHDPSIVKSNGQYYLFGTHMGNAVSSNLTSWSTMTTNVNSNYASIFSVGASWASQGSSSYSVAGNLWAPDVIYNTSMKKWCMYMSVNGDNWYSSIALATADSITGPYTYQGTIVYSGFVNSTQAAKTDYSRVTGSNTVASRYLSSGKWNSSYGVNAIDPCVLYDANGDLWMSYGSWFGGIYMLKLDKNTGLRDYSTTYSTSTNSSDQYFGKKISGGYGCTGEGSYIVYDKSAGYYYLYMSYNGLNATDNFAGYHMRLFRSSSITGPYTDAMGNNAICTSASDNQTTKGIKLMGNYYLSSLAGNGQWSSNGYMSPGHNSAFIDDDGQRYVIYHTRFNKGSEAHEVRVHQQFLNQDKWPVTAVYENLGSKISSTGYSSSDIVGTYDFVNHGNSATTTYTGMLPTNKVVLNSNGTITGDVTGTWSAVSGSYYCTMVIGGVTYKGVFFKQYDESASHSEVMTFSLIGSNNQAIFGSKTSTSTTYTGGGTSEAGLDGIYYIRNRSSNKYLDVANGSAADGTNIQQWSKNSLDSQKFKLVSDGNGYYYILTGASGYTSCLDVDSGSNTDGANIIEWNYWGGEMQKYEIVNVNGSYAIKTKASGSTKCLDVYNISNDDGANVCQWTYWGGDGQRWYLEDVKGSSVSGLEGTYYVQNKFSGLYLDIENGSAADGANIRQWYLNGSDAQKFKFVSDGNGYYYILTGASGYTKGIDIDSGSANNGANAMQWTYWGGFMQKYEITYVNGSYAIKTKASGGQRALEVYLVSSVAGENICQWDYWGGDGQLWNLERADMAGTYYIKNQNSGLYMDVADGSAADGTNIRQWSYNGSTPQKFKLVADGAGYYYILTGASGYKTCVDIDSGLNTDGANVRQWPYNGSHAQKYKIVYDNGAYAIKTMASDGTKAIDVLDMSKTAGANICQWTYWGGAGQKWTFTSTTQ